MDAIFNRKHTPEEERYIKCDFEASKDKYSKWHKVYWNGTDKKVGNPILDKIHHLYNDEGCKIVYVYKDVNDTKCTNYQVFTTWGQTTTYKSLSKAKEDIHTAYMHKLLHSN